MISFRLARNCGYTEFDLSHELRGYGWQVPAYTMPDNATDISVLRIVVREGLSADLARALHDDARSALASLDKLKPSGHYTGRAFRPLTCRNAARGVGSGTIAAVVVTPTSLTPGVLAESVVDLGAIEHNVRVLREHAGARR